MKKRVTFLFLCLSLVLLCACFVGCGTPGEGGQESGETSEQDTREDLFKDLTEKDSFTDGKPYHLYFLSNGDGTCTLKYITTDPACTEDFEIDIPAVSPAGDTVTAVDVGHGSALRAGEQIPAENFPFVLTASVFDQLCKTAEQNGIPALDLMRLQSCYHKVCLEDDDDEAERKSVTDKYPIAALGEVYVFSSSAKEAEIERTYTHLTKYCAWDDDKYAQSVQEVLTLVKQSTGEEQAELCLTAMRHVDLARVIGIRIPATVTAINNSLFGKTENLQDLTVAEDNPTIKLIDGCLVDTATGTLKMYFREDGEIPASAGVQVLDAYAFSLCRLQEQKDGAFRGVYLTIPEGVTEIKTNCFADVVLGDDVPLHVFLPLSLSVFGRPEVRHAYHYEGTMEAWEELITFTDTKKGDYVYVYVADWDISVKFELPYKKK